MGEREGDYLTAETGQNRSVDDEWRERERKGNENRVRAGQREREWGEGAVAPLVLTPHGLLIIFGLGPIRNLKMITT